MMLSTERAVLFLPSRNVTFSVKVSSQNIEKVLATFTVLGIAVTSKDKVMFTLSYPALTTERSTFLTPSDFTGPIAISYVPLFRLVAG